MTLLEIPEAAPSSRRLASNSFPALRLTETQDHMTVVALVPGFSETDLDVTLVKGVLCLSGRCSSGVPRDFSAVHRGRRVGDFKSEIKLRADVACSDTEALLERGVLTIRMRKDAPSSRSSIPIRLT
jgi:HSP20 family protein